MKKIFSVAMVLGLTLLAANTFAAKIVSNDPSAAGINGIKKPDGVTVDNMTPTECRLVGGEIVKVTAANCGSGKACFVKLATGATGGACITK